MEDSFEDDHRIREGFIGQKMFIVPRHILREIKRSAFLNPLYFTDIGFYPNAANHFRERDPGAEEFILIYCIEGEGWIKIETKRYHLGPNSFFIIPRKTAHTYGAIKNNPWSIYWMHFSGIQSRFFYKRYEEVYSQEVVSLPLEQQRINLFENIFSLLEIGYSKENVEYLNILLWELLSSFLYVDIRKKITREGSSNRVDKSIQYMKENLNKPLSISKIANQFHYSNSQYFTEFKKKTGYPPLQYFNQMKVQEACQYLSFTSLSIKEISYKTGFQDPYYFSRLFKKIMGLSPLRYRNAYK